MNKWDSNLQILENKPDRWVKLAENYWGYFISHTNCFKFGTIIEKRLDEMNQIMCWFYKLLLRIQGKWQY